MNTVTQEDIVLLILSKAPYPLSVAEVQSVIKKTPEFFSKFGTQKTNEPSTYRSNKAVERRAAQILKTLSDEDKIKKIEWPRYFKKPKFTTI